MDFEKRFWDRVDQQGPGDCWNWKPNNGVKKYGYVWVVYGNVTAHRVAYVLRYKEKLTEEDKILHHCDNPSCCNPNHLFKGTTQDNVDDKMSKGRQGANSKFYEGEVFLMKKLFASGIGTSMISRMFRCIDPTISRIIHKPNYLYKRS